MNKELILKIKKIAFALRHSPSKFNLILDSNGWCDLSELISKLNIRLEDILLIINSCDKKRFSINDSITKIKANQGHSVEGTIKYNLVKNFPKRLFHGTKKCFIDSILIDGLLPKNRQYVHLSLDKETALNVANRRSGESILLEINVDAFKNNELYISDNGVYLTKTVKPIFIKII